MNKIAVFALLAVLAGCSDDNKTPDQGKATPAEVAEPTSVDYYLAHEAQMKTKLKECNTMSAADRQADAACETAALAHHRWLGSRPMPKLLPDEPAKTEKEKARTNPGQ